MKELMAKAGAILREWKGSSYVFADGALKQVGPFARTLGRQALLVVADLGQEWMEPIRRELESSLNEQGVTFQTILGAAPNAPREDLYRIALQLSRSNSGWQRRSSRTLATSRKIQADFLDATWA